MPQGSSAVRPTNGLYLNFLVFMETNDKPLRRQCPT